jgi:hypothetical protein
VTIPSSGCSTEDRRDARLVRSDWLEEHDLPLEAAEQRLLASGRLMWKTPDAINFGHACSAHRRVVVASGAVVDDLGLFSGSYRGPYSGDFVSGTLVIRNQAGSWKVFSSGGLWQWPVASDWRQLGAGPVSGQLPPKEACLVAAQWWMSSGQ